MRALLPLLMLVACGEPISNSLFYEEAGYLDALPTSERFFAPADFLDLVSTDPILVSATGSADQLRSLFAPMTLCGEALVAAEPDVRGDTFRTWDVVPVVVVTDQGTYDWWTRGTVTALEDGAWTWTMEGSRSRAGPWHELASGRHEASNAGYVSWRLDLLGQLLDVTILGSVEHVYAWQPTGGYAVETRLFANPVATDPLRYWGTQGNSYFAWTDLFEVTNDGESWPGVAFAAQTSEGGRADGYVWVGDDALQVGFGDCWNASGASVWTGGDPLAQATGNVTACVLEPLLDDGP